MLKNLSLQQRLFIVVLFIILGSLTTNMMSYIAYRKVAQAALEENSRMLKLVRETVDEGEKGKIIEAGRHFQATVMIMTRKTLTLIVASTIILVIICVLLSFLVARSFPASDRTGAMPEQMSADEIARVLEKAARDIRMKG